jgi:hypothetical protein
MAQTKVKLISDGVIVQGNLHASHGITTADIGEGSNLYYTDARVGSYLSTNSFATESYVGTQIANLVDSSPSALNTLNELAAALGDDANFSTTVTNSIALKAPLASPSFTGDATFAGNVTLGRNIDLSSTDYTYLQGTHTGAGDGDYLMRTFGYGDSTFYGSFDILRHDTDDGELRLRQRIAGTATDVMTIVDGNVGIGTTSPDRILHIESDSVAAIQLENTSEADSFIDFKNPSRTFRVGYDDSADLFKVAVTNFNSNAFVVNSSGNVGIGTDDPDNQLHIASTGTPVINLERVDDLLGAGNVISVLRSTSLTNKIISQISTECDLNYTSKGRLMFYTNDGTNPVERMRIDSSGVVSVTNSADAILKVETSSGTSSSRLFLKSPTREWRIGVNDAFNSGSLFVYNTEANTYPFLIDTSGVVQIKNDLPRLQLYNTDTGLVLDQVIGTIDFYKSDPSGSGVGVSSSIQVRSQSSIGGNSYMSFHTDGGAGLQNEERMRIDREGNVGIGVTPFVSSLPNTVIDINPVASIWGYVNSVYLNSNAYYNNGWLYKSTAAAGVLQVDGDVLRFRAAASGTANAGVAFDVPFIVDSGGNVGIGTTSPSQKLHVVGKSLFTDDIQLTQTSPRIDYGNTTVGSLRFFSVYENSVKMELYDGGRLYPTGGVFLGSSNNSNLLDDYEEGTFSTSIIGISASTNTVKGIYTKIGNICILQILVTLTGISSGTGNPYHSLPFTPVATNISTSKNGAVPNINTIVSGLAYMGLYGINSQLYANTSSGGYINYSNWSDGLLSYTLTYRTV